MHDGKAPRPISIERNYPTGAPGSVLIACGETRVLCTASIADDVPGWLANQDPPRGWVTAEYNMLPGSTRPRKKRGTDGRSSEIQRLIARVLRASVDLHRMPGLLITCDCEVLKADGGTRTTSINGAMIALIDALEFARKNGKLEGDPLLGHVAAMSVGIVGGRPVLDLDYDLDSTADVDLNVAMNDRGEFVEIQGTGEQITFRRDQLDQMLDMASEGIRVMIDAQKQALSAG